jgi:hypothetical protein
MLAAECDNSGLARRRIDHGVDRVGVDRVGIERAGIDCTIGSDLRLPRRSVTP